MSCRRRICACAMVGFLCAQFTAGVASGTGVPIAGFSPLVGIGLTNKFKEDDDPTFTFFQADREPTLSGTQLGVGGTPHYDVALIDTGAAVSLLTTASDAAFNVEGAGFRGTVPLTIGGATGFLEAVINDPLAIFATGLANRTGTSPLTLNTSTMIGQSSVSVLTIPEESDLPNVLGIPFSSQYATYIRNDQPQIFKLNGKTVRTPQIQFLPLGSGGQGIVRRAPITLDDPSAFASPPNYIFNFENIINGDSLTEDPQTPTILGEGAAAYFMSVNVSNNGQSLNNSSFFFDTGADVTVVSELNAVRLGFDPVLDEPEFTVTLVGSGGVNTKVPGFFVDQLTIQAIGGSVTLSNVPVVVLDVVNPAHAGNIVDGILGMNTLAGRNVVIDPKPALGGGGTGPSLFISDPVTNQKNWTNVAASGTWETAGNWSGGGAPTNLSITNVRYVSGGNQTAVLGGNTTVWELNVSGGAGGQTMTVQVQNGVTLTTFSGVNIETGGVVALQGGTIDTQYVELLGGELRGSGSVATGSGPIVGQVENRSGVVSPGNAIGVLNIDGRFANAADGTLKFELGGTAAGTQYDQLVVSDDVALGGTLNVTLANLGGGAFQPSPGNSFTLITSMGDVGGEFDHLQLPGGFQWNVAYNAHSVVLSLMGAALTGDYNANGVVDAGDYVVWRNSLGATGAGQAADGNGDLVVDQNDYAVWRSNFGKSSAGSGAAIVTVTRVPEPGGATLAIVALIAGMSVVPLSRKRLSIQRVRSAA